MGYTKDIVILYTNDVHCGIEDNLGYTKLAQYKEDLQQDTPYITLLDAGDAIQGAPIGKLSTGEAIINIMNEIGYDFAIMVTMNLIMVWIDFSL